ncbi:hypothetical protein E2C01_078415 [Portunus trituberculatus]|uniref:Uncharacterized protein n=1 Tax=Portunus trituberculatus TaxID=210409 RepID=A0A5B7IGX5_PORTR|nr:hypothetical protein [Portunus trituberculatus]
MACTCGRRRPEDACSSRLTCRRGAQSSDLRPLSSHPVTNLLCSLAHLPFLLTGNPSPAPATCLLLRLPRTHAGPPASAIRHTPSTINPLNCSPSLNGKSPTIGHGDFGFCKETLPPSSPHQTPQPVSDVKQGGEFNIQAGKWSFSSSSAPVNIITVTCATHSQGAALIGGEERCWEEGEQGRESGG